LILPQKIPPLIAAFKKTISLLVDELNADMSSSFGGSSPIGEQDTLPLGGEDVIAGLFTLGYRCSTCIL
jgi:hypothetical protein